jgi:hypothetical protein
MTFTRDELLNIYTAPIEKLQEVTQTLINKLVNKEVLSLAESKFICLSLKTVYSDDPNAPLPKAEDFDQCSDFLFWEKYLLYWHDHEGWGEVKEQDTILPLTQKKLDVALLNSHYEQWKTIIYGNKFTTSSLQTIASETNRLIKEVTAYSKKQGEGSNRHKYIEKALILHSKYLYYQVSEYYEENNKPEENLNLCGNLIVIDNFVYIHTLFGHFAADIKFNRPGKSYHRSGNVDFRNIPKEVLSILQEYKQHIECQYFNKQAIFFNLAGTDYAIWFRPLTRSVKGESTQAYLRVQTYYPVELPDDQNKISGMNKIKVSEALSFYITA